ncbi:cytochrome c [Flavobacteriales bacterium]|nr:cytochrome c [Flavobacteriales bacterium]
MNKMIRIITVAVLLVAAVASCTKGEDSAGYEYTPDMYRSPAIEAYVDYGMIKDYAVDSLKELQSARLPGHGSIPFNTDSTAAAINMPYELNRPIEDYDAADSIANPISPTEENLKEGARIYSFMCVHCHGEKGKGDGAVVAKSGHAAPGAYDGALKDLSVGKMFHTLTHGKGMMGSHASQLSKKERWQVILHVQALQNGGVHPSNIVEEIADSTQSSEAAAVSEDALETNEGE